ncbi:ubiquitin fusion degradation protein [Boothiomyces sp. JEL0866]|nr:ubiquitin fusion degradation protein [Boothiomyces sp. JEL0866]
MMPGKERENVNFGGKIILPPSSLQRLSQLHIEYPMLFELKNKKLGLSTHAGVLEFIAEEGRCYLPRWMLATLGIQEGEVIEIENTSLALGKFVKIQPQSVNFLDISDPKAVLEQAFRYFSCLTQGDIITISYNDTLYDILVMETKPSEKGISIIETDLEVDFAAPKGYVEPTYSKPASKYTPTSITEHTVKEDAGFKSFNGQGQRLNNKTGDSLYNTSTGETSKENNVPNALILPEGKLYFGYRIVPLSTEGDAEPERFSGTGQSLRQKKKK